MPSLAYNNLRKNLKSPRLRRVYVIRDNMNNDLFKRTFTFLIKNGDDEYSADYYKQQYIISLKNWI
jgi:hypothetical protein